MMNIDASKSYATEANLVKAIEKRLRTDCRYLVVRNRAGRYTAVFGVATCRLDDPMQAPWAGFMLIN